MNKRRKDTTPKEKENSRDSVVPEMISHIIVDPESSGLKDFWMKEGLSWLTTAILHVVSQTHLTENRKASLADVRSFMLKVSPVETSTNGEDTPDYTAMFAARFESLLVEMLDFDHENPVINQAVANGIDNMLRKSQSERSGVHFSAMTGLSLWANPIEVAEMIHHFIEFFPHGTKGEELDE